MQTTKQSPSEEATLTTVVSIANEVTPQSMDVSKDTTDTVPIDLPKKRGRPKKVLTTQVIERAKAIAKVSRQRKKDKESPQVAIEDYVPQVGGYWPFPSSTRYNSDGTDKQREEVSSSNH